MIVNPNNIHRKIHNPRMFYPQSYAEMTFVAGTAGGACLTRRSRQVREMTTLIKHMELYFACSVLIMFVVQIGLSVQSVQMVCHHNIITRSS